MKAEENNGPAVMWYDGIDYLLDLDGLIAKLKEWEGNELFK